MATDRRTVLTIACLLMSGHGQSMCLLIKAGAGGVGGGH